MSLESPVASPVAPGRARTRTGGPSSYLDENAGTLDSAGRRLALAEDGTASLPERLRVLADTGHFVDQFFQLAGAKLLGGPAGEVRLRVQDLLDRQRDVLAGLRGRMGGWGVELCDWAELGDEDRQAAGRLFTDRILPVLGPLVSEPGAARPLASNLSINLAVGIGDGRGRRRFASIEIPPALPRFVRLHRQPGGMGGAFCRWSRSSRRTSRPCFPRVGSRAAGCSVSPGRLASSPPPRSPTGSPRSSGSCGSNVPEQPSGSKWRTTPRTMPSSA